MDALTVFAQSIDSSAKEIQRFYEREDWTNYTTKVHALKSTARVIGAEELSDRAKRLEDAGNNGYCDEIREGTGSLLQLYRSFRHGLAPLLPREEDNGDKPPISDEELSEAWQAMGEIVASFDYDSLGYVLEELSSYSLPEADAIKLKEVKDAARLPDWEKLTELLILG
jgi:HPt (histidine-containing phosphotransfer) domain-containing protein